MMERRVMILATRGCCAVLLGVLLTATGSPAYPPISTSEPVSGVSREPGPPLALRVTPVRMAVQDTDAELQVRVEPLVTFSTVSVEVVSSDLRPMNLLTGASHWQAEAHRGRTTQRRIVMSKEPNLRRAIEIRAVGILPNGERVIHSQTVYTPSTTPPTPLGTQRTASDGRALIEYPAAGPPR